MNRDGAKQAVKTFIRANEAALLLGLAAQGEARVLEQVTTSISPPTAYYWIGIECVTARSYSLPQNINSAKPPEWVRYEMVIHMSDYTIFQLGDDEAYEGMHSDFDLLGDRIVRLIRPQDGIQTWIPAIGATPRFLLRFGVGEDDQIVDVNSLSLVGQTGDGLAAMLYTTIKFPMHECADLGVL